MNIFKTVTLKHVIGVIILITFSVSHITTLFHEIPRVNEGPVNHSLGILDAAMIAIVGYYFGSSAGSKAKTEIIESLKKE